MGLLLASYCTQDVGDVPVGVSKTVNLKLTNSMFAKLQVGKGGLPPLKFLEIKCEW